MLAVASTYMNLYERNTNSSFAYTMWFCCTQWAADEYTKGTVTENLKAGKYLLLDFPYETESINIATRAVNTVLSGTRVTSSSTAFWVGNGTYNIFSD